MPIAQNFPTLKPTLNLDFANVKALDPRITFTRASEGRFYDGRTFAKAEENLFSFSQQFDNASWGKGAVSVTPNTTVAPDGTTTADTITANGTTSGHFVDFSITAQNVQRTISVFARAGTNNFLQIRLGTDTSIFANFDLSTGTLRTVTGGTADIQAAPNSFYRCTLTFTSATANAVAFNIVTSGTAARNESNSLTTTVILWGAQLEQRSSVTAYTPTTTQPITRYQPQLMTAASGVARFDHNPVTGESLGLLIEEQRQNLVLRSDDFANAAWVNVGSVEQSNVVVAPDGTLTADLLTEDTSTGVHELGQAVTLVSATTYAISVYAKAYTRTQIRVAGRVGGSWSPFPAGIFDLVAGTVLSSTGSASATIQAVGNGWFRCTVYGTTSGTSAGMVVGVASGGTNNYTGDGYSGVFIWGAQLEAGAFPTSYIPTVASQATRQPDLAVMTGTNFTSWFSPSASTLYTEATTSAAPANLYHYTAGLSLGTNIATGDFLRMSFGATKADITVGNNGTFNTLSNTTMPTYTVGVAQKFAVAMADLDVAASVNGITPVTNSARNVVDSVDTLSIGAQAAAAGNRMLNGHIRRLAYYPTRLANATLQTLTT